ncbi:hypothetical protein DFQ26_001516 [Actinomortierella ambigua]|nr:hypothetical protein DFQ26_001516 [Actinomortierella ambigua]
MVMFFENELTSGLIPEYESDAVKSNTGFDCDTVKSDVLAQFEVHVMRSVAAVVASMWLIIDMWIGVETAAEIEGMVDGEGGGGGEDEDENPVD